jgi:hypothetical protein
MAVTDAPLAKQRRSFPGQLVRQVVEAVVIVVLALAVHAAWRSGLLSPHGICLLVVGLALIPLVVVEGSKLVASFVRWAGAYRGAESRRSSHS